jgi:hypothetical protein
MAVLRCRARLLGRRGVSWGSIIPARAAGPTAALLAVPAPAHAGILGGGGTPECIVSAPFSPVANVLSAGAGVQSGSVLSFVDAVTLQMSPSQVSFLQAIHGIASLPTSR